MSGIRKKVIAVLLASILTVIIASPVISATPDPRRLGIVWVYDNDPALVNTQADAEGFMNTLVEDGWVCDFNKNEEEAHRSLFEETNDENYVDSVHIAYYAGHGWKTALCIHPSESEWAYYYNCEWGNEGPNKWMALASCYAGKWWFGYTMYGTHLILGWKTPCDDRVYGPVFADYCINGFTLKEAWFETGKDLADSGCMRVLGETSDMGFDHLYGYGYVSPDPTVDDVFVFWDKFANPVVYKVYPDQVEQSQAIGDSSSGQSTPYERWYK